MTELYHYGVLGMKWGIHRAKRNTEKAANSRESAKEWDELARNASAKGNSKRANKYKRYAAKDRADAKKYDAKSKQIEQKHRDRAGSKTYDRVSKTSTGKLFAESMVLGTYGALKYNQFKAEGHGTGQAFVNAVVEENVNILTGGLRSFAEPRLEASDRRAQRRSN